MHLSRVRLEPSPLNRPPRIVDRDAGVLDYGRDVDRVCIYGAGYGSAEAPLEDESWVVWALNLIPPLDSQMRLRCDVWWDVHQRVAQTEDDLRWIAQCPVPIYVTPDLLSLGPHCVSYPLHSVKAYGGSFACTFAYQVALALSLGVKEIGLYGVELSLGTTRERTVEWANLSWWMGFASARGVTFRLPSGAETRLGTHQFDYGFEYMAEIEDVKRYLRILDRGDAMRRKLKIEGESVGG